MTPVPTPQKPAVLRPLAFVGLIGLEEAIHPVFRDSFKQFGIETTAFTLEEAKSRFLREKFEGVVLRLDPAADPLLAFIRSNAATSRMVVYGICATAQEALRCSNYGINAIFNDPVERHNLLRVIRATHLLVLHELRRYVRIPLVSEVNLRLSTGPVRTTMVELSSGGLSVQSSAETRIGESVSVSFRLPNSSTISLQGVVAWVRRDPASIGIRFMADDPNRSVVRAWINDYLDVD